MHRGTRSGRFLAVVVAVAVVASVVGVAPVVAVVQQQEDEPNDSRDNAQQIETGEEVTGELTADDEDWYAVEVEAGETINATVDGDASSGEIHLRMFVPGNGRFDGEVRNETATMGRTVATDGTAYLRVQERGSAGADYSFTVDTYRTEWFEPNEDRGNATQLYENPLASKTATNSIGDEDWFSFEIEAGETINVTAAGGQPNGQVGFKLFRPDGTVEQRKVAGGNTTVNTTAATDGTAYFRALDRGAPGSTYNFIVVRDGERLGLPNDRFERGNPPVGNQNQENAPEVTSGTYNLAIVDDDRDVLAVDLAEGERVRAVVDFDSDENDLALELTDDSGTAVTDPDPDSATGRERVAFTAPDGGTYYLHVTGEPGATTTYDLDLAVLERTDVTVGPGVVTVPPESTMTVNVTVTDASAGVSNAELALESTDTSVLRIQSVEAVGPGSISADVADDGGTATATVTGLNQSVTGTVTVARVTVATVGSGSATLEGNASVAARSWFEYPLGTVQSTSVEVGADGTTATNGFGPGFGALVSLVVAVGTALLATRRRAGGGRRREA